MDNNSEIHKLITDSIVVVRADVQAMRTELKLEIASLRPCFQTKKSCDELHTEIDRRMVDKTYFAGGVAVLLLVIAILGVILAVVRF